MLHWVEQAAIEAQAALAVVGPGGGGGGGGGTTSGQEQAVDGDDARSSNVPLLTDEEEEAAEEEMCWPTCERSWSHSDELDQLCAIVGQGMAAGDSPDALAERMRGMLREGALCWGRCVSYCCSRRRRRNLLMECARSGAATAVRALLARGGGGSAGGEAAVLPRPLSRRELDLRAEGGGHSALHYAAYGGHEAVVHALLHAGADAALRNARGETAEQSAMAGGHPHLASVLVAWTVATAQASSSSSSSASADSVPTAGADGQESVARVETAGASQDRLSLFQKFKQYRRACHEESLSGRHSRELILEPSMGAAQRKLAHDVAGQLGLRHESRGEGAQRRLHVWCAAARSSCLRSVLTEVYLCHACSPCKFS
jgi:hypothetical protein